jgi:AraC family transcriptional regulator
VEYRVVTLNAKKLVGQRSKMSLANNRTYELWRSFMPRRKEIVNGTGIELLSVEVYPADYFDKLNPAREFEKWAAIEVSDFNSIPANMDTLVLPSGLYAVFQYKGPASGAPKLYQEIYTIWLLKSGFRLDNRPHFALMGVKYKNDDPNSEEEIWIPVKPAKNLNNS